MEDLTVRAGGVYTPVRTAPARGETSAPIEAEGAERQSAVQSSADLTVSDTLRALMTRLRSQLDGVNEGRRLLRLGESTLAEAEGTLRRMAAASGSSEWEALSKELDRLLESASVNGSSLFRTGESPEGAEQVNNALLEGLEALLHNSGESASPMPAWLLKGISQTDLDPKALLTALGLDADASPEEILAAVKGENLSQNDAAGRLAALYLGTVIANANANGTGAESAMDGLRQLMELVADGVPLDTALQKLTGGLFTSLADFESQFTAGTAPDMMQTLFDFLLTGDASGAFPAGLSALALMAGLSGNESELLMGLLSVLQGSGAEGSVSGNVSPNVGYVSSDTGNVSAEAAGSAASVAQETARSAETLQLGGFTFTGRDLSQVRLDPASGAVVIAGGAVTVQGEGVSLVLEGAGTVTLRNVSAGTVSVAGENVQLLTDGENVLDTLELKPGASLTIGGAGLIDTGALRGDKSARLTVRSGALLVDGGDGEPEGGLSIAVSGAASAALRSGTVTNLMGQKLTPFDVLWKTFLPGFQSVASVLVDGSAARMTLSREVSDMARLWLQKDAVDPGHGYPVHTVAITGRDEKGRLRTRYAYLRWDDRFGAFEEVEMFPNPFIVTGGEEGTDWTYEESSQTLRILTDAVTGLSGGQGVTAEERPFSGRVSVAGHLGPLTLTLSGVDCRVAAGRAFDLGRENRVTLLLAPGTESRFQSGAGCAGISVGDGTFLTVDRVPVSEDETEPLPVGKLACTSGDGGAGLGRDSGGSWDRVSGIHIKNGQITAVGSGGGAGIGAGRHGFFGTVTVSGGVVTARSGGGGGAGIGGGLGAPVGDITLEGGRITATASYHAAGIGAGIEGECGKIFITGSARLLRVQGGDPGADIGACLFGKCGGVEVTGGADIGPAQITQPSGGEEAIPLQTGAEPLMLPKFCLSSQSLRLHSIKNESWEDPNSVYNAAKNALRRVARIRGAYNALSDRMEESLQSLQNASRAVRSARNLIRDPKRAGEALSEMKHAVSESAAELLRAHSSRVAEDVLKLLK